MRYNQFRIREQKDKILDGAWENIKDNGEKEIIYDSY